VLVRWKGHTLLVEKGGNSIVFSLSEAKELHMRTCRICDIRGDRCICYQEGFNDGLEDEGDIEPIEREFVE
jgi:hypothetical protein